MHVLNDGVHFYTHPCYCGRWTVHMANKLIFELVFAHRFILLAPFIMVPGMMASLQAQPGCSPPTTSGSCANALPLTVNAACVAGTTCQGGAQGPSTCLYTGSQCSWYRFTATAASMYVNIDVTTTDGCNISSNVYRATGPCTGLIQVSCVVGAPLDDAHLLNGLAIGALYYIQVCYPPGGPCGNNGSAEYCIEVGIPDPPCSVCSTPCGAALGYSVTPTIPQVVADCTTSDFGPPLQPGQAYTFCNTFTATATIVDFNVIITSDCGTGNVTNFTWTLYSATGCGVLQTGVLNSLIFNGLVVGNSYVFCYTFTVPANCTHTRHCPYFVGATTLLPVTWLSMDAIAMPDGTVDVSWATVSEQDSDHFTVERSPDARQFEDLGTIQAGGSMTAQHYWFNDPTPLQGSSYYRVRQTDGSGAWTYSNIDAVRIDHLLNEFIVAPNPIEGDVVLSFTDRCASSLLLTLHDASGRLIQSRTFPTVVGANVVRMPAADLESGVYFLRITGNSAESSIRILKG